MNRHTLHQRDLDFQIEALRTIAALRGIANNEVKFDGDPQVYRLRADGIRALADSLAKALRKAAVQFIGSAPTDQDWDLFEVEQPRNPS